MQINTDETQSDFIQTDLEEYMAEE